MTDPVVDDVSKQTDGRAMRRRDNAKRLFDAAMRLAQKSGYQSVTATDICAEAGVGRATFFRIYKSKAGLLREFNRRLALELEERLKDSEGDTAEKLSIFADEIALAWQRVGSVLAAMVDDYKRSTGDDVSHRVHQELFDLVVIIVAEGIATDELRDSMPVERLASLIFYQINIAVAEASLAGEADLQSLAKEALKFILIGVGKNTD